MAIDSTKHLVKRADLSDLDTLFNIVSQCDSWLSKQGITYWNNYYTKEKITQMLQEDSVFLIYDKDVPCGTITVLKANPYAEEDSKFWTDPNAKAIDLICLCVLPEYQGAGLAVELLTFAEDYARKNNAKYVRFGMFYEENAPYYKTLANFYLKRGYKFVGGRMGKRRPIPVKFLEKMVA